MFVFNWLFFPLFSALWQVIRLSLWLFKWIQDIFLKISLELPFYVLFGTKSDDIFGCNFSVPEMFFKFLIISLLLIGIFLVY